MHVVHTAPCTSCYIATCRTQLILVMVMRSRVHFGGLWYAGMFAQSLGINVGAEGGVIS